MSYAMLITHTHNYMFWYFVLQLEKLVIHSTDEEGALEKTREETCPGNPFIVFSVKPTVQVILENPTPRSGLFTITSDISTGDTAASFTNKIAKIVGLKGKSYIPSFKHTKKKHFQKIQDFNRFSMNHSRCRCTPCLAIRRCSSWPTENTDS